MWFCARVDAQSLVHAAIDCIGSHANNTVGDDSHVRAITRLAVHGDDNHELNHEEIEHEAQCLQGADHTALGLAGGLGHHDLTGGGCGTGSGLKGHHHARNLGRGHSRPGRAGHALDHERSRRLDLEGGGARVVRGRRWRRGDDTLYGRRRI